MLARRCAETGKRASLELGGHAPFVVFADADLELAAEKLTFSKLQNAGQTCIAANRVLVERPALARLGDLLVERVAAARVGDGLEPGVTVGPLIDGRAVDKVGRHVEDALARGARILFGGGAVDGLDPERFFAPTVLADVPPDALIAREETFGPVAPLIPFDAEEEAVALANASEYGLAAYVFTRDLGRAHRVGEALDYGMVAVNDGALGWVQAPFGGVKGSAMPARAVASGSRTTSTCSTSASTSDGSSELAGVGSVDRLEGSGRSRGTHEGSCRRCTGWPEARDRAPRRRCGCDAAPRRSRRRGSVTPSSLAAFANSPSS